MKFTDLFIKRPVLSIVVSLLILVLGLRSVAALPILQYPFTENAVITVTTTYVGADANDIASFITTPLENSIAQASGIDYLTSSSTLGVSTIQANLHLNYNHIKALAEINSKVGAVINQLPKAAQLPPTISVAIGQPIDAMYIGFYSKVLPENKITDYLTRVVQPKLQAINGIQTAEILGSRTFALRAWLDPVKLAGFKITPADVAAALARNDFITAVGRTDGNTFTVNLTATTSLHSVEQFKKIVIRYQNGAFIRLQDVAKVSLGSQNYNSSVAFDGKSAVYIGIKLAPEANLLSVLANVVKVFPEIQEQLPEGLEGKIVYNSAEYVNSSIREVIRSLFEAFTIVTIVVFLFLGSLRALVIPVIAIPLSLIGTFCIMLILGYSINLLTLLALVLAIGLVVDDAIIIVENVHRHMEEGMSAFQAAIKGARELANPIIAISVVLVAVYLPIGFMGGLTGALFTEFAFTLASAVGVSAVIALTLSPMMCSRFLKINHSGQYQFIEWVDGKFNQLKEAYKKKLTSSLDYLPVTLVFAAIILISIYFLYATSKSELAPQEDQGVIISQIIASPNTPLDLTEIYSNHVFDIFRQYPENDHVFQINGEGNLHTAIVGTVLKPWDERKRTSNELQPLIQQQLDQIAGAKIAAFQPAPLPGNTSGLPIQFVITSTAPFDQINTVVEEIMVQAQASGMFLYLDPDLKIDQQQTEVVIDRDKAAEFGLSMQDIGNTLSAALSENYINYFNYMGRSYQVIPQMTRNVRFNADQLKNYYINTAAGTPVSLATLVQLKSKVVPESVNHFQQLNSATISAVAAPGVTMGQALETFQNIAKKVLPAGYGIDYASQSRQYIQESSALAVTFFFALIIIFLSLAAQFESFRDPIIVLISVPMSICGAMIFISLGIGGASLNIYTEVGLVTLIGLISKHGILIVQFANDLQREGKSKREAIETAASVRLRPILMTTGAMVLGVIPLIRATGAGALSRYNLGLVIATGISIGTLFTLFVVPAMYMLIAQDHSKKVDGEIPELQEN